MNSCTGRRTRGLQDDQHQIYAGGNGQEHAGGGTDIWEDNHAFWGAAGDMEWGECESGHGSGQ